MFTKLRIEMGNVIFFEINIVQLKICRTFAARSVTYAEQSKGALAQLVEQWTENPCVPGSIPGGTTKKDSFYNESFFCV